MEKTTDSFSITPLQLPSRYSIFKRLANLILAILATIACVNLWLISSEHAANWHTKQNNQLGDSLSILSAKTLKSSLIENDTEKLSQQLGYIASDPHVSAASLFDNKGRLLADNNIASSVVAAFKLNAVSPLVFVQPITHQEQIIGYLSVMLKEEAVMAYHSEYQHRFNQQVKMLMLLAAIAGILITRAFYKVRYKQLIRTKNPQQTD